MKQNYEACFYIYKYHQSCLLNPQILSSRVLPFESVITLMFLMKKVRRSLLCEMSTLVQLLSDSLLDGN